MAKEKKEDHLPLYGIGPYYTFTVLIMSTLAVIFRNTSALSSGKIPSLRMPFIVIGWVLIILGVYIWSLAVFVSKVDKNIKENHLVTTGIYSWVRNPIYSGVMITCTGMVIAAGNIYFFFLPILYWLFMTVLMMNTEEKWLNELYGKEYEEYCKKVNRCIPFPPKSSNKNE
ncbi:hypothetical protein BCR32DRAFT_265735 [Anaeromyces robustus]|uniref:Protein-S-isoprenylcysteine O-methyltransferase n=1 Tax=Anaeromyces robustus TaxID=1754192 RepID=A0A1Y1XHW5_9FUNG|nr:hypothetical protein BCR32DRAFT_265735 [Anaeromyces robustus]|eukprot:ORX85339.1 hypothetical protein BCR32DRAFT_265735 [Anaeromyces robustus]